MSHNYCSSVNPDMIIYTHDKGPHLGQQHDTGFKVHYDVLKLFSRNVQDLPFDLDLFNQDSSGCEMNSPPCALTVWDLRDLNVDASTVATWLYFVYKRVGGWVVPTTSGSGRMPCWTRPSSACRHAS